MRACMCPSPATSSTSSKAKAKAAPGVLLVTSGPGLLNAAQEATRRLDAAQTDPTARRYKLTRENILDGSLRSWARACSGAPTTW